MKYLKILLIFGILFAPLVYASDITLLARTGNANKAYEYTFNFTTSSDCTGVLLSYSNSIVTGSDGDYVFSVPLTALTGKPNYLCEYRDGSLRQTHNYSDIILETIWATNVYTNNITAVDWSNITLIESQISDLVHTVDTNTQKTTSGSYVYNDSSTIYFNETVLNTTIDSRSGGNSNLTNVAFINETNTFTEGQIIDSPGQGQLSIYGDGLSGDNYAIIQLFNGNNDNYWSISHNNHSDVNKDGFLIQYYNGTNWYKPFKIFKNLSAEFTNDISTISGDISTATYSLNTVGATVDGLSSGITGQGTAGYIPVFNGTTGINNSVIFQNGSNVGIGTTDPQYILDINKGTGTGKIHLESTIPTMVYTVNRTAGGGFAFNMIELEAKNNHTSATLSKIGAFGDLNNSGDPYLTYLFMGDAYNDNAFRVYADKKVYVDRQLGIGTANPTYALEVNNQSHGLKVSNNLYVNSTLLNSLNTFYVKSNSVGIGTDDPQYTFDINRGTGQGTLHLQGTTPTMTYTANRESGSGYAFKLMELQFKNDVTTADLISIGAFGSINLGGTPTLTYLYMGDAYNNNTFRLYPDKTAYFDGKVGIGDTTPSYELDVNGDINSVGDYYNSGVQGYSGTCASSTTITVTGGIITGCS